MMHARVTLPVVAALSLAAGLPAVAGPLRIGSLANSRVSSGWTLDGSHMQRTRAKLLNPANFGAAQGLEPRPVAITDVAGTVDAALLASLDVFFVGYVSDASAGVLTNGELTALQTWVNGGGTLIAACDDPGYDATCAFFGHPADAAAQNPMTPAVPSEDLFNRPFGKVGTFNGSGSYYAFTVTANATVMATDNQGKAVLLRKDLGLGRVFLMGDVDFLADSATTGDLVTNANDRLLANLFSVGGTLRVGSIAASRFGSEYTLNGSQMVNTRSKLLNPKLFGYDGTYKRAVAITDTPATLTSSLLAPFDVFFIGYLADSSPNAFTGAELTELQTWVSAGGLLIATCDDTGFDAVCSAFGHAPSVSATNPMAPVLTAHPLFASPFGVVTTFNGQGSYSAFPTTTGASVLAADAGAKAVILSRPMGSGQVILMGDVDFVARQASVGDGITNDADRLIGNTFAFGGGCCKAGDVNGDGAVDVFDVVLLSSYIVGNQPASTPPFVARAASGNLNPATGGAVDIFDLVILQSYIVGNYSSLPI